MPTGGPKRGPGKSVCSPHWHEIFLDNTAADTGSVAESVATGHSILVLDSVSSASECESLAAEASQAATKEREAKELAGLVRRPVRDFISAAGTELCDALLLRQLALLDAHAPTLRADLFGDIISASATTLFTNEGLAWSEGEPALNVYTAGGQFTPHEDEQSLTCLVNISKVGAYEGGGTAFWSREDAGANRSLCDTNPPTALIAPPPGTAIIFGGTVTHAAQPIVSGERIVFVASFSPASRVGPARARALRNGLRGLMAHAGHPPRPTEKSDAGSDEPRGSGGARELASDELGEAWQRLQAAMDEHLEERSAASASAATAALKRLQPLLKAEGPTVPSAAPTMADECSLDELCAALTTKDEPDAPTAPPPGLCQHHAFIAEMEQEID